MYLKTKQKLIYIHIMEFFKRFIKRAIIATELFV